MKTWSAQLVSLAIEGEAGLVAVIQLPSFRNLWTLMSSAGDSMTALCVSTGTEGSSAAVLESAVAAELERRVFWIAGMRDSSPTAEVCRSEGETHATRWAVGMRERNLWGVVGPAILISRIRRVVWVSE